MKTRCRVRVWPVLLVGVAAVWSCPTELAAQAKFSAVEAVVREELQQRQVPGAAVAIVQDGVVVYARAFGVASIDTGDATRPEMLFRLGSTTKMFTAATVVLLAQQGKLDLQEPVGKYIPGLAPRLRALTAHQLLSHTSGMLDEAPMFGSHDDAALENEAASWTDARLFAEPGEIYSYSNPAYWLAGLLAQEVAGTPFADQVAASIFAPLGMMRSTFRPTIAMTYPLAQGHDVTNGKPQVIRPAANNAASWPAGSIFSSVTDLARWVAAFVNGGVVDGKQALPAALFARLSTPAAAIPGSSSKYGYGVQMSDWRGLQVVGHGGSRSGYGSIMRMVPSRRFGVVVLANRTGVEMSRTADAAMESMLQAPPDPPAAARQPVPTTAADRGRVAGVYSQGARLITIDGNDRELFMRQDRRELLVQRMTDHEFVAGEQRLVFVSDASGAVTFLHAGGRSWKKIK